MKTHEVQRITGLTRKALLYYEHEGLIRPRTDPANDYRDYTDADVERLLCISILRQIGLPVSEIHQVLDEPARWSDVLQSQLARIKAQADAMKRTASAITAVLRLGGEGADQTIQRLGTLHRSLELDAMGREGFMRDQLTRLFPGNTGRLFAAHYAPFLDGPLDSEEKRQAWLDLVTFLDGTESLHDVLGLEAMPEGADDHFVAELEAFERNRVAKLIDLTPAYVAQLQADIAEQARQRQEDPELHRLLDRAVAERAKGRQRLAAMGYYDHVVKNLLVLSERYRHYQANLHRVGQLLGVETSEQP